jgi:chromosome partitioning protein
VNAVGYVVTFSNMKGGVGKTSLVLILAQYLANEKHRVLVIDMDPQANLTTRLLEQLEEKELLAHNAAHVLGGEKPLTQCILPSSFKNIDIVPSHIVLNVKKSEIKQFPAVELVLKKQVEKIKDEYDFIVIDTPPDMDVYTLSGIIASDKTLSPVTPDFMAMAGFEYLLGLVRNLENSAFSEFCNIKTKDVGLVVNMVDRRYVLHKRFLVHVAHTYPEHMVAVVTRRVTVQKLLAMEYRSVLEAMRFDPYAAQDIRKFVSNIIKWLNNEEVELDVAAKE